MKIFSLMEQQHRVDGHLIPSGAFYGRLNLRYTDKIKIGVRKIYDKNGHAIFRADGTQVVRNLYRLVDKQVEVTYSVEDLFTVTFKDGEFFRAWYKITRDGKWREGVLCANAITRELNKFLAKKLQEYCAQNNCTHYDLCEGVSRPHLNRTRQVAQSAAHRREVQTDFIYKGGEGGLIRASRAINEEVTFVPEGASIPTVLSKHREAFTGGLDERPIISRKRPDFKMVGKEPTFIKHVTRPDGTIRSYYNVEEFRLHEPKLWEEWALEELRRMGKIK